MLTISLVELRKRTQILAVRYKLLMTYTDHTQSMQMLSLATATATASYLESVEVSQKSPENHVAGALAEFLLV